MIVHGTPTPVLGGFNDPSPVWTRRRGDLDNLAAAVRSGDARSAENALTSLRLDMGSVRKAHGDGPDTYRGALGRLFDAVDSGDMTAAKAALDELSPASPGANGYGISISITRVTTWSLTIRLGVAPAASPNAPEAPTTAENPADPASTDTSVAATTTAPGDAAAPAPARPSDPFARLAAAIRSGDLDAARAALSDLRDAMRAMHGHHGHGHHHHQADAAGASDASPSTTLSATATKPAAGRLGGPVATDSTTMASPTTGTTEVPAATM